MTTNHEYTPSTVGVRNAYIDHRYNLAAEQGEFPPGIVERMNEFDRWYAAVFGRIEAAAEQRGKEQGWDEGHDAGVKENFVGVPGINPYRADQMECDDGDV